MTEFYHHGSIFDILHKAQSGDHHCVDMLAWNQRLSLLLDVASGMEFLHSRNYVHGDLRSPNVFVTSDNRAKIGDFGFCQLLGEGRVSFVLVSCLGCQLLAGQLS